MIMRRRGRLCGPRTKTTILGSSISYVIDSTIVNSSSLSVLDRLSMGQCCLMMTP